MKIHVQKPVATIPDGTYRGKIAEVHEDNEYVNPKTSKKVSPKIRLVFNYVSHKYKDFARPTATIWLGSDDKSSFIRSGTPSYEWLTRLTNLKDFENFDSHSLVNTECLIKVKTKPSKSGDGRVYTNVVDIYRVPDAEKDDKQPQNKNPEQVAAAKPVPAQTQKVVPEPKAEVPVVKKDEFLDFDSAPTEEVVDF